MSCQIKTDSAACILIRFKINLMVEAKKYTEKEIRECMETFSYIPMKNLHFELEAAQENGKYVLCVDKNENS